VKKRPEIKILRTDSSNPDFISLVRMLDADLAERDGKDHSFYAQFNKIDTIRNALVLYAGQVPVACGAFRELEEGVVEIKRMYTLPSSRGSGYAGTILKELERWAAELGYSYCQLETGMKQPEAISLYRKNGYTRIPNYGQYAGISNSCCFRKEL
jgi:putative acetyltransferase